MRFRELIAQHDPDGRWTSRVQLGIKYQPEGTCLRCHYVGLLLNGGFGSNDRRRALCPQCGGGWSLGSDGQTASVAVRIVRDPALTAVERRRRAGQGAPELPAISRAVLKVLPRAMQSAIDAPAIPAPQANRFDFSQPLRSNSLLLRSHAEDRQLTEFLVAEIGKVFSDSTAPPGCPHCAGNDTRLIARPRTPSALPAFQCRSCMRCFTRATLTPMANMLRKDMLFEFLPWLSQHRPLAAAAAELGTTPKILKTWVQRFRQWLLMLDPSGQYEQRVRLGLKAPWPVLPCPHCGDEVPAKPHGFRPTRAQFPAVPAQRLFRCSVCDGFFDTKAVSG
jgi:transposase-like protein